MGATGLPGVFTPALLHRKRKKLRISFQIRVFQLHQPTTKTHFKVRVLCKNGSPFSRAPLLASLPIFVSSAASH